MARVVYNERIESLWVLSSWYQQVDLSSNQEVWLGVDREEIWLWQKQGKTLKPAEGILCMSQYTTNRPGEFLLF